jgi:hypothetical protein
MRIFIDFSNVTIFPGRAYGKIFFVKMSLEKSSIRWYIEVCLGKEEKP